MSNETDLWEWVCGGLFILGGGGFAYLMNAANRAQDTADKTGKELSEYQTHVAENYLTKDDFTQASTGFKDNFTRLEGRIDSGNRANLESNEKIRTEVREGQNTIISMISNNEKLRSEFASGQAAIIAAIGTITKVGG